MKKIIVLSFVCIHFSCTSQVVADFIKECNLPILKSTINELSGETPTKVKGATVTIRNRVSSKGNDLAADYIKEKLNSFGLTGMDQVYKSGATGGRNVYAIQTGKTKPTDIFIICGHYDAVADYCADDNLSGTVTVLEAARILSKYCFESTIVYAFWDEEEIGLVGSKYYANNAKAKKEKIIGVLNIDMSGYDGDNDRNFDIDLNSNANSVAMKDLLLELVSAHQLNLIANVVDPGTSDSDHASFWPTYGALLLGECWSKKDVTPFYHSAKDRESSFNWPYYFEMTKLAIAYIATAAVPVKQVDLPVIQLGNVLTANVGASSYQWLDCSDFNAPLTGQTGASFNVSKNGSYAVRAVIGGCSVISDCYTVNVNDLDEEQEFKNALTLFPNPSQGEFSIDLGHSYKNIHIEIRDINGKLKYEQDAENLQQIPVHFEETAGVYAVIIEADHFYGFLKLLQTDD